MAKTTPVTSGGTTHWSVRLDREDDFEAWRQAARHLLQCGVLPSQVDWAGPDGTGSLFACADTHLPPDPPDPPMVRASKAFVEKARHALCHSDPHRFALLYRLLWQMQHNPRVMEDKANPDVAALDALARNVRRDMHKMRAFTRFRLVPEGDEGAADHHVAWFEPDHHILRANAGFFVRRFAAMRWSILTPRGSLHWNDKVLEEGPPAHREDAPADDPAEDLWRTYYASTFNPARLKIGAMVKEMPRKYWANMPETALIPGLIAGAQARESAMVAAGEVDFGERPVTLDAVAAGIAQCRRCPIGCMENRAVMGEGPGTAPLMIVGEQPGDQEDRQGRPFIGPAGQVLNDSLRNSGIDRQAAYLTNAVKHFKFQQTGKRRLHQAPSPREIDMCRWWLESERAIVRPRLVLALGASAGRSLLGKTVSVARVRGTPIALDDGAELWVTAHPSYLLRLDGDARDAQAALFEQDLRAVALRMAELARVR